jgi:hypothetical protein
MWRSVAVLAWILLLLVAGYFAFWAQSLSTAGLALGIAIAIVIVPSLITARRFRQALQPYRDTKRRRTSVSSASLLGRVHDSRGVGFGLTRVDVSPDGIRMQLLGGLFGVYWFPISEVVHWKLLGPSLNTGFVTSLRWSTSRGPILTFSPLFGDAADLSRSIERSQRHA